MALGTGPYVSKKMERNTQTSQDSVELTYLGFIAILTP